MISEFQDLSDKIDRLAQLSQSLRAENHLLRKANGLLGAENIAFKQRMREAEARIQALLAQFPAPVTEDAGGNAGPEGHDDEATR